MTMTAVIVIMIMTAVIVMTTGALHVVIILTMTAVMTTVMTAVHEAQYVTYEPCTGVLIYEGENVPDVLIPQREKARGLV